MTEPLAKIYSEVNRSQLRNAWADMLVQLSGTDLRREIAELENMLYCAKKKLSAENEMVAGVKEKSL